MNKFIIKQFNQKMTKISTFLLLFCISCSTFQPKVSDTVFSTIYKNHYGRFENAGYVHIKNNEEYIKLIESLKIDESEYNQLVSVNFKTNDVVVLYLGQKNTGGYSIDVASVVWEKEVLLITKKETFPAKGEMVTMAITSPYCITIIPKAKNIKVL